MAERNSRIKDSMMILQHVDLSRKDEETTFKVSTFYSNSPSDSVLSTKIIADKFTLSKYLTVPPDEMQDTQVPGHHYYYQSHIQFMH